MPYDSQKRHERYLKNKDEEKATTKNWMRNNRGRWNKYQNEYARTHRVQSKPGKFLFGNKRPRPELCELCKEKKPRHYHHYDDTDISKGIWVCPRCHHFAEVVDNIPGAIEKYNELKEKVLNVHC